MRFLVVLSLLLPSCAAYIYDELFPPNEYVIVSSKGSLIEVYSIKGSEFKVQQCLLDNIESYSKKFGLAIDEYPSVNITDTLPKNWAAYYYPAAIAINNSKGNQLSAYGHELVRHYCWESGECDYKWPDTPTWTGYVGELWFKAENISLEFCP